MNLLPVKDSPKCFEKGATRHCCYRGCKSDSRYNEDSLVYFIPFPKPCKEFRDDQINMKATKHINHCEMCKKADRWARLCYAKFGLNLKKITKWTHLCSLHFEGHSGPTPDHPDPIMYVQKRKSSRLLPRSLAKRKRYDETCTSSNTASSTMNEIVSEVIPANQVPADIFVSKETTKLAYKDASTQTSVVNLSVTNISTQTEQGSEEKLVGIFTQTEDQDVVNKSISLQTTLTVFPHMNKLNHYEEKCKDLQKKLSRCESAMGKFESSLKVDEKKCVFYTGLRFEQILLILTFMGESVNNLNYWKTPLTKNVTKQKRKRKFTPIQELLLVLVRLRRGFLVRDLAYRFYISSGQVTKLTITWVQLLFHEFSDMRPQMFPSLKRIKETLPAVFEKLKNIRVIVDCTEFFCESPLNYRHQGNLYSQYKSHTTFKVLIGCTPNGAISFVSDLFEGAMSDREVFQQCNIIDFLKPDDLVLADRGFTVNDLVQSKGATLNIPPFLSGRDRLTAQEEIETKNIAKERIYVEHAIGRLKNYRFLKRIIPLSMRGIINQMVFVCACLVNFEKPIVLD